MTRVVTRVVSVDFERRLGQLRAVMLWAFCHNNLGLLLEVEKEFEDMLKEIESYE